MKAIVYLPKYPEPNHKDFDTFDEVMEARKKWTEKIQSNVILECPNCKVIRRAADLTAIVIETWDNDPYNPRCEQTVTYNCHNCHTNLEVDGVNRNQFKDSFVRTNSY